MLNSQCTIMVTHKLCIVLYELCIPPKKSFQQNDAVY